MLRSRKTVLAISSLPSVSFEQFLTVYVLFSVWKLSGFGLNTDQG